MAGRRGVDQGSGNFADVEALGVWSSRYHIRRQLPSYKGTGPVSNDTVASIAAGAPDGSQGGESPPGEGTGPVAGVDGGTLWQNACWTSGYRPTSV